MHYKDLEIRDSLQNMTSTHRPMTLPSPSPLRSPNLALASIFFIRVAFVIEFNVKQINSVVCIEFIGIYLQSSIAKMNTVTDCNEFQVQLVENLIEEP